MNESQFKAMAENDRRNRVLQGLSYYACVHKPNTSGKEMFNAAEEFIVTLGLDDEAELKKAEDWGLRIFDATDSIPHPHVKVKRKIIEEKNQTAETNKPDVVDSMQKPIPPSINVGNESRVAVKFSTYWPPNGDKYGAGTVLFKVQVKELVEYNPEVRADSVLGIDESGFSIEDHLSLEKEVSNDDSGAKEAPKKVASSSDIFDD